MLDLVESGREKNVLDLFLDLGKKYDAEIYEIFLWADKQTVIDRANERGYEVKVTHTPEKVANTWDQMNLFKMKRTNAIVVDTNNLSQAEVFKKLKDVIGITDNNEIVS